MLAATQPQRILVVDDDKEIVRLLRAYLEEMGYQVMSAYDGKTALHMVRNERISLMILDVMLPEQDGWDVTRIIRRDPTLSNMPIVMLTALIDDTDKIVGLELGADDYILKPFNPREVVARIRSVLRRSQPGYQTPEALSILQIGSLALDLSRRLVTVGGQPVDLTPTEFDLLRTLMANPGYVFTRAELIEQSLGYNYESLERTLDTHIKNLRKKIEPEGKPNYIQTVYGIGYRLGKP